MAMSAEWDVEASVFSAGYTYGAWRASTTWRLQRPPRGRAHGMRAVALCYFGKLRNLPETADAWRAFVIDVLDADVFVAGDASDPDVRSSSFFLKPVSEWLVESPDHSGFSAMLRSSPNFSAFEQDAHGINRRVYAPMFGHSGSGLWQMWDQHRCFELVRAHEAARGFEYTWVGSARTDWAWTAQHPSLDLLDPQRCWVPYNTHIDQQIPEFGLIDSYALCGRAVAERYFERWRALRAGHHHTVLAMYRSFQEEDFLYNWLRLGGALLGRFPNLSSKSCCAWWEASGKCCRRQEGGQLEGAACRPDPRRRAERGTSAVACAWPRRNDADLEVSMGLLMGALSFTNSAPGILWLQARQRSTSQVFTQWTRLATGPFVHELLLPSADVRGVALLGCNLTGLSVVLSPMPSHIEFRHLHWVKVAAGNAEPPFQILPRISRRFYCAELLSACRPPSHIPPSLWWYPALSEACVRCRRLEEHRCQT